MHDHRLFGVDPEVGNYGIDRGVYPVSRFFNFGVNINFYQHKLQ